MTPAEIAELFPSDDHPKTDDWGDDDWGSPTPAQAPKTIGKLNFTDQSTTPDAEVRRARDAKVGETVNVPALGDVKIVEKGAEGYARAVTPSGQHHTLHPTTEAAAVIPPDAPANDANAPAPVKRGRKPKAESATAPGPVTYLPPTPAPIELGPESMALLKAILAALTRE